MLDLIRKAKHVQAVTSVTVVNNTAKTVDVTTPSGKKWALLGITAVNPDDVARIITYEKYKEAGKTNRIARLNSVSTAAGVLLHWPTTAAASVTRNVASKPAEILSEGNVLSIIWAAGGASAGGTDADGLVVEYLEIDE